MENKLDTLLSQVKMISGENDLRWKLTSEEKLKSATVTGRGDQGLKQSTRTKVTIDNFWK